MDEKVEKLNAFVHAMEGAKKLERYKGQTFWKDYPFPERYESVADHSWRMAMMLVVVAPHLSKRIDLEKALTIALIHDVPEILAGDASPLGKSGTGKDSHAYNKQIAAEKFEKEKSAAKELFGQLPEEQAKELYNLWIEYEEQGCYEAEVVKAIDKMEAKFQTLEYTGGNVFAKFIDFYMNYGIETWHIDPILKELGDSTLSEMKENYKEFKKE